MSRRRQRRRGRRGPGPKSGSGEEVDGRRQEQEQEQEQEREREREREREEEEEEDVWPEMGGKLVELYRAERLEAYLAPTYTRAALIYSMFANEDKAREYAEEAVLALEREYGPYATDLQSMRQLAENPRGHWSWGIKATSGRPQQGRNGTEAGGK